MDTKSMRLFRYRQPNTYLMEEIQDRELYLWNLNQQNDPFEGRLLFENNLSKNAVLQNFMNIRNAMRSKQVNWKEWLISKEEKEWYLSLQNASDKELELLVERSIERGDYNEKGIEIIKNRYHKMTDHLVMACFSAKKNCPIMFAHYAKNHSGVCLEYEVDKRDFFEVNYVEEFPKMKIFNPDEGSAIKHRMLTKHEDWAYEKEYRLILYNRKPGAYKNDRISLKKIYFGLKCSEETKTQIKEIVLPRKDPVELFTLSIMDDQYKMKEYPYETFTT